MILVIQGDNLTVRIKSAEDLDTRQIVMAHQLATGNYEALFVEEDNQDVDTNEASTDSPTKEAPRYWLEKGDPVFAQVNCPSCGCDEKAPSYWGNTYTKCPVCDTRLFNSWATERPGEEDRNGCAYHANSLLKRKEELESASDGPYEEGD